MRKSLHTGKRFPLPISRIFPLALGLLLLSACAPSPKAAGLDPEAFASQWRNAQQSAQDGRALQPILVDVYRPEVRERKKAIEGAHVLRFGTDKPRKAFEAMDRETPVYLYCGDGRGSAQIAKILEDLGFAEVNNLNGGLKAWVQDEGPTVWMSSLAPIDHWSGSGSLSPSGESPSPESGNPSTPSAAESTASEQN